MIQPHTHDHPDEIEEHDRGLVFDLQTLDRRRVLKLLGFGGISAAMFTIAGCGPSAASGIASASAGSATTLVKTAAPSRSEQSAAASQTGSSSRSPSR